MSFKIMAAVTICSDFEAPKINSLIISFIPHLCSQTPYPPKMLGELKQNPVCTRKPHRDWARPAFECLSVSSRGTGQQWPAPGAGRGSGCSRPECGISPLEGGHSNPTMCCQNLYKTGKTDSWRAQSKPCTHQDPEERSSDPTRD